MSNYGTTVARYIDAWNEADDGRRGSLVASTWTEQGAYADPLMQSEGHASINAMIGAARQHFPGHRFTLQGAPDNHGAHVRFCWVLAPENGPPVARGNRFRRARRRWPVQQRHRLPRPGPGIRQNTR